MFEHSSLCEADERHALIIGYSFGDTPLPADFLARVDVVEDFAKRYNFTSVTVLKNKPATPKAVTEFFAEHAEKC